MSDDLRERLAALRERWVREIEVAHEKIMTDRDPRSRRDWKVRRVVYQTCAYELLQVLLEEES